MPARFMPEPPLAVSAQLTDSPLVHEVTLALHLVVAYETASSPELRAALAERAEADAQASFALLVPATPRRYLVIVRGGRANELASRMAESARAQLESAGLNVAKAVVGKPAPLDAIADELAANSNYASIIICTHPADVSRWLKAEVPAKATGFGLPVTHVVVRSVAEAARSQPGARPQPWRLN